VEAREGRVFEGSDRVAQTDAGRGDRVQSSRFVRGKVGMTAGCDVLVHTNDSRVLCRITAH